MKSVFTKITIVAGVVATFSANSAEAACGAFQGDCQAFTCPTCLDSSYDSCTDDDWYMIREECSCMAATCETESSPTPAPTTSPTTSSPTSAPTSSSSCPTDKIMRCEVSECSKESITCLPAVYDDCISDMMGMLEGECTCSKPLCSAQVTSCTDITARGDCVDAEACYWSKGQGCFARTLRRAL